MIDYKCKEKVEIVLLLVYHLKAFFSSADLLIDTNVMIVATVDTNAVPMNSEWKPLFNAVTCPTPTLRRASVWPEARLTMIARSSAESIW
jgi:hypothetical protein